MEELKPTIEGALLDQVLTEERVDDVFGFAYKRCFSRDEAQDLCQDIIVGIVQALSKDVEVDNIDAYIWRIAHNTYYDHVRRQQKRKALTENKIGRNDHCDNGFEEDVLAKLVDAQQLARIKREIAFLGRTYREVMLMFYLEELPISAIAGRLGVPENRVKQRLFSARGKIRRGVGSMETTDLNLRPNYLNLIGNGDFSNSGGVWTAVERLLAHNILVSCRKVAKSAEEVAKELQVPSVFMENEMAILEAKGVLVKSSSGKYLTDFIIIDLETYCEVTAKHHALAGELRDVVARYVGDNAERIMSLGYLSPPESLSFALWSLIPKFADQYIFDVAKRVLAQVSEPSAARGNKRRWTFLGHFFSPEEVSKMAAGNPPYPALESLSSSVSKYGMDGGSIPQYDKYKNIHLSNFYGARLARRYSHPSNIYGDPLLLMVIRSIGGLPLDSLDEDGKETAAKALEKKLLKKVKNSLYPNILVFDKQSWQEFYAIEVGIRELLQPVSEKMVAEYLKIIEDHLPSHLHDQASVLVNLTSTMRHWLIEECIKDGTLHVPDRERCGEGMWIILEKQ